MNIASITQRIAIMPELVRATWDYFFWTGDIMVARINGTDPDLENHDPETCEHDHSKDGPLELWEAGALALEFLTLIKSRAEYPAEFNAGMDAAIEDVNTPQHAVDVIVALANMLAATTDDEAIDRFRQFFLEAEASA